MNLTHSTANKVKQAIKECHKTASELKGRAVLAPYWSLKNFPIQQFTKQAPLSLSLTTLTHTHTHSHILTRAREFYRPTAISPPFIFIGERLFLFLFFSVVLSLKVVANRFPKNWGKKMEVNSDSR